MSGGTHSPCTRYEAPIEQASIEARCERHCGRRQTGEPAGAPRCDSLASRPGVLPGTRRGAPTPLRRPSCRQGPHDGGVRGRPAWRPAGSNTVSPATNTAVAGVEKPERALKESVGETERWIRRRIAPRVAGGSSSLRKSRRAMSWRCGSMSVATTWRPARTSASTSAPLPAAGSQMGPFGSSGSTCRVNAIWISGGLGQKSLSVRFGVGRRALGSVLGPQILARRCLARHRCWRSVAVIGFRWMELRPMGSFRLPIW